ncbi:MAG TPA: hypothetical protein VGI50_15015 [Solirubrobacteraceae bacterium]
MLQYAGGAERNRDKWDDRCSYACAPAAITDITMIVPYTVPAIVSGSPKTNRLTHAFIQPGMFAERIDRGLGEKANPQDAFSPSLPCCGYALSPTMLRLRALADE